MVVGVSWGVTWFCCVFWHLVVLSCRCLHEFDGVCPWFPIILFVCWWLLVFANVFWCLLALAGIFRCLLMFPGACLPVFGVL